MDNNKYQQRSFVPLDAQRKTYEQTYQIGQKINSNQQISQQSINLSKNLKQPSISSLKCNPSLTTLTQSQNRKIGQNQNKMTKKVSKYSQDSKTQNSINASGHGLPIYSSTGGNSFLKYNFAKQNSNKPNQVKKENFNRTIGARISPNPTIISDHRESKKNLTNFKTNYSKRTIQNIPKDCSFNLDRNLKSKHLMNSQEQLSQNLQSDNQSLMSSKRSYNTNNRKFKIISKISQQESNKQFSKTLGSHSNKSMQQQILTEEDYFAREEQLSILHQQLKDKSIQQLTDQVMLKELEIKTLKKQLSIMREQIISQSNNQQSQNNIQCIDSEKIKGQNQDHIGYIEEESKSQEGLSFDNSSLQEIQKNEDPYQELHIEKKTLQRTKQPNLGSQKHLPIKGLVKCESSSLNNKLGKMKSTADLFKDFRSQIPDGEDIKEFIMNQKPKEQINLEEIIRESIIEASQTSFNNNTLDNEIDDKVICNKSLSLYDHDENKEMILDDLLVKRQSKFNESVLDRLCETSGFEFQTKNKEQPRQITIDKGMNNDSHQQYNMGNISDIQQLNQEPVNKSNLFNLECYTETCEQDYIPDTQQSQQIIIRNEDSFTSKQTNEYVKDLLKNQRNLNSQSKSRKENSPSKISNRRSSSNETARLSFSKDDREEFQANILVSPQNMRNQQYPQNPQIIGQITSILSIKELLNDQASIQIVQNKSKLYKNQPKETANQFQSPIFKANQNQKVLQKNHPLLNGINSQSMSNLNIQKNQQKSIQKQKSQANLGSRTIKQMNNQQRV